MDGENTLSLSVPTDELINAEEVAAYEAAKANDSKVEKVVPIVPWERVLQRFAAPEIIDAFRSPETNQLGTHCLAVNSILSVIHDASCDMAGTDTCPRPGKEVRSEHARRPASGGRRI